MADWRTRISCAASGLVFPLMDALAHFHFIRPYWLLSCVPLLALWWTARRRILNADSKSSSFSIAPHLVAALQVGRGGVHRPYPIDGVVLVGVLLSLAAAGPTWSRQPSHLVAETAPLVIALKVTPSMQATDLAPSRLDRARFKILDLIASRAGARTALVAYAGTAHRVAPLSEDPNILRPLLQALSPQVMPVAGDNASAALDLAHDILARADTPGALLYVLDDLDPAQLAALNAPRNPPRPEIVFLVAAPEKITLPQLHQVNQATVINLSANDTDLDRVMRAVRSAHQAVLAGDDRLQWEDRGLWLVWPAALLAALWFRRGWTMRWQVVVFATVLAHIPQQARAESWVDWFLTPDQQGRLAFEDKRFFEAGDHFEDPVWKAHAYYRAGRYGEAIEILAPLETPEAALTQGLAEIRSGQYRAAVRSFETALLRQPGHPAATHNLALAMAIVEYVENAREQSDTGEEAGIGADDIVFDNESDRGSKTQIEAPGQETTPLTAEQWIQSIDTQMEAYLRGRFLLENAQQ